MFKFKSRKRALRRHYRHYKGLRRVKNDANSHFRDQPNNQYSRGSCPCLADDALHGKGKTFARFADYPDSCRGLCCINDRYNPWHSPFYRRTIQERRTGYFVLRGRFIKEIVTFDE